MDGSRGIKFEWFLGCEGGGLNGLWTEWAKECGSA
jgi:hypothetical protein